MQIHLNRNALLIKVDVHLRWLTTKNYETVKGGEIGLAVLKL